MKYGSPGKYNHAAIAAELTKTALGDSAVNDNFKRDFPLVVALGMPSNTQQDNEMLRRWLSGGQTSEDRFLLQDYAIRLDVDHQ